MKRCPRCQITKPFAEFHVHKSRKDGRNTYCKLCQCHLVKTYRNAEMHNRQRREWRKEHPAEARAEDRMRYQVKIEKRRRQELAEKLDRT